jgi:phytoene dehydrogenase-like protein
MNSPLFIPTHSGLLYKVIGFNARGKEIKSLAQIAPYTPIRIKTGIEVTSIRTDKSASQSRAEEAIFDGRVLVSSFVTPVEGGRFAEQSGKEYKIEVVQEIFDMNGQLDHYQVDLSL